MADDSDLYDALLSTKTEKYLETKFVGEFM